MGEAAALLSLALLALLLVGTAPGAFAAAGFMAVAGLLGGLELRARNRSERALRQELAQLRASDGRARRASEVSEQRVDRVKSEFVSTVSHELRTPLTSIQGALGLVLGGAVGSVSPQAKSCLEIAHRNGERLIRLVNDILDLEKIESGQVELQLASRDVRALAEQAIEANRAFAEPLGVRLALEGSTGELPALLDGDRLTQVLTNLISNAAKFSPRGEVVTISVERVASHDARSPGLGRVRVSVRDHGPGIPEEFRARIFTRFAQADSSDARQKAGTGLGLNISKLIVERHRGRIGFESIPDGGTTFWFEIPESAASPSASKSSRGLLPVPESPARALPKIDEERLRAAVARAMRTAGARSTILHVEDDLDVVAVVATIVRDVATVVSAPTLRDARALLETERFDLVLLDLGLPDGDGLSLVDAIHGSPSRAAPVVIFSANEPATASLGGIADALVKSKTSNAALLGRVRSLLKERRSLLVQDSFLPEPMTASTGTRSVPSLR